jgi:hypothetical protein
VKRVFIIHGWGGFPEEAWIPWLKKELQKKGFEVFNPAMPDTNNPKIDVWINALKKLVGIVDEETYFVGHSIGCQAILRYLETLDKKIKVGNVVLVAPWLHLDAQTIKEEGEESVNIAKPWVETPINFEKIVLHIKKITCIFSDSDPFVPLSDAKLFKQKLNAKTIIEKSKGHFSQSDEIKQLPIILKELIK